MSDVTVCNVEDSVMMSKMKGKHLSGNAAEKLALAKAAFIACVDPVDIAQQSRAIPRNAIRSALIKQMTGMTYTKDCDCGAANQRR